jgi:hypothetical protein
MEPHRTRPGDDEGHNRLLRPDTRELLCLNHAVLHPQPPQVARHGVVTRAGLAIAATAALTTLTGSLGAGAAGRSVADKISITPMHVVGGPTAAVGTAVVITVGSSHNLHLEGIVPDTGAVRWSRTYSESATDGGIAPYPEVLDNVVIDMQPAHEPGNPLVNIVGINATTGAVAWRGPQDLLVGDSPSSCEQQTNFCITGYNPDDSSSLAILDPVSGRALGVVNGPVNAIDRDLYQTTAKTTTIEALGANGKIAWSKTLNQLYGGPGYDTTNGWDFTSFKTTEVGTAGANDQAHSDGLSDAKTIGFSLATGQALWTLPGAFQCFGSLGIENPPFNCVFSGRLVHPNQTSFNISYKGLSLNLQGFDPATGKVTWSVPVRNVDALGNGTTPFLDDSHIVVQQENGKTVLLDTSNGTTASVGAHRVLWCAISGQFKVNEPKVLNPSRERADGGVDFPCTANGAHATGLPTSSPDSVGPTVDGVFLWPAPGGLARHVIGSAEGNA